jgi:hypothetical protein
MFLSGEICLTLRSDGVIALLSGENAGWGNRFIKSQRYHESIPLDIEKRNKEELFRISKYETSEGSALWGNS